VAGQWEIVVDHVDFAVLDAVGEYLAHGFQVELSAVGTLEIAVEFQMDWGHDGAHAF
jgi:hypothetical protein